MKSLIAAVMILPLLAGCLNDYEKWTQMQSDRAKWRATAEIATAEAFGKAIDSKDPVVAAVAANGLSVAQALRAAGKGASNEDAALPPPRTWGDRLESLGGFLLGAGNIAAQFNATNKGAAVAMKQIDGQVAIQQAQSAERVSIFDRFGATSVALGNNIADVGKQPSSVTTITGDRNTVANNGSTATSTETTQTTIQCSSGPGGIGVPATQSQSQTQGQQGQTTNSQTNAGTTGAPSGTVTCTNTKGK